MTERLIESLTLIVSMMFRFGKKVPTGDVERILILIIFYAFAIIASFVARGRKKTTQIPSRSS